MFSQPEVLARLAMDPRTRPLLADPVFKAMLADLQRNPTNMAMYMQNPNFQLVCCLRHEPSSRITGNCLLSLFLPSFLPCCLLACFLASFLPVRAPHPLDSWPDALHCLSCLSCLLLLLNLLLTPYRLRRLFAACLLAFLLAAVLLMPS
jgi:hypothetical protein